MINPPQQPSEMQPLGDVSAVMGRLEGQRGAGGAANDGKCPVCAMLRAQMTQDAEWLTRLRERVEMLEALLELKTNQDFCV